MRIAVFLLGIVLAFASRLPRESERGSLVVSIVSQKGDYVVAAAESRNTGGRDEAPDNKGCKIISLGGDTLFFATGNVETGEGTRTTWDARETARKIYAKAVKRDALSLSSAWKDQALRRFKGESQENLSADEPPNSDVIVTGGFITFTDGIPSVQSEEIRYLRATKKLSRHLNEKPPGLGQLGMAGLARPLVQEFLDGKTLRAIHAFGPVRPWTLMGMDVAEDETIARKSIQFAIDYSTGEEHDSLGGPIDIAVLKKDQSIEWPNRQPGCYDQDLPASKATHAPISKKP